MCYELINPMLTNILIRFTAKPNPNPAVYPAASSGISRHAVVTRGARHACALRASTTRLVAGIDGELSWGINHAVVSQNQTLSKPTS